MLSWRFNKFRCDSMVDAFASAIDGQYVKHETALGTDPFAPSAQNLSSPRAQHWLAQNIPCQSACPAGTDIPGYLEAIYRGEFAKAYEINLRDNVFPAVLGRVCSRPCEGACRHGWPGNGEPVAICFSKRSSADFSAHQPIVLQPLFPKTGRRVAIIGAGVAGLSAARELALWGHQVTVLEKHRSPGGMLNQGIPMFRLPRAWIAREIEQITALGVEIRCGVAIGADIALTTLLTDYDAVVMAAGTLRPNILSLSGVQLPGIEHGLQFLLQVNEFGRREIGKSVIVIGGGYTALDCARTALRLGAQTTIFYRRGIEDMVVLPGEVDEFRNEGGKLETRCAPREFLSRAERVSGARFIRTTSGAADLKGRSQPMDIIGSDFDAKADSIILATGQFPRTDWIDARLKDTLVNSDEWLSSGASFTTAQKNLFVAGDFALGATTLISAIGHAKDCAKQVDRFLMGADRLQDAITVGPAFQSKSAAPRSTGRTAEMNSVPLHFMPTLANQQRTLTAEVETGFDSMIAKQEASRCYLCHYKFEIIDAKCILCDECINVKPVEGCIVEISALLKNEDGIIAGYERVTQNKSDSLYYNRLWIDQNQCVRCGACEAACPVNAITIQKVSTTRCSSHQATRQY
jgi:NADPH-dependent glutamate synthase beta subunit-like oxidoreductase/ferredoxin